MNKKTIVQRIKTVSTYEHQQQILSEWAIRWQEEQMDLLDQLYKARKDDDHDRISIVSGQLRGMSEKRFPTLRKLFNELSRPDHQLVPRALLQQGNTADISVVDDD